MDNVSLGPLDLNCAIEPGANHNRNTNTCDKQAKIFLDKGHFWQMNNPDIQKFVGTMNSAKYTEVKTKDYSGLEQSVYIL